MATRYRAPTHGRPPDERDGTREVTGEDAPISESRSGDAGSGASPFGADVMGLEGDPSSPRDILPDAIEGEPPEGTGAKKRRASQGAIPMASKRLSQLIHRPRGLLRIDQKVSIQELRRSLARARFLPVVDGERRFQGFVTRTDMLALSDRPPEELIELRSILRTSPQVGEDESLEAVARALLKARVHVLPVVNAEGRFAGLINDHAVLRSFLPRRRAVPTATAPAVAVDAVMTREPVSIGPDGSVEEAAGALLDAGIRHLPVVDAGRKVIGMISERDIRERIGADPREWFNAAAEVLGDEVANVMTPDPVVVRSGSSLVDALELLEAERIGALPVVDDDDRLVGVLSYVDALAWIRAALARRRAAEAAEPAHPSQ